MSWNSEIDFQAVVDAASIGVQGFKLPLLVATPAGYNHAITAVDHTAHTITVAGDKRTTYPAASYFRVVGSTSGANDGLFKVASVAYGSSVTTITIDTEGSTGTLANDVASGGLFVGIDEDRAKRTKLYAGADEVATDATLLGTALAAKLSEGFGQKLKPAQVLIGLRRTSAVSLGSSYAADASITATLDAIAAENKGFWAFCLDTRVEADVVASGSDTTASAWAQANERLFVAQADEAGTADVGKDLSGTDIGNLLEAKTRTRTALLWIPSDSDATDWDLVCNRSAVDPDTQASTWDKVTLSGPTINVISGARMANLKAKHVNTYTDFFGVGATGRGVCAGGGYIDELLARDLLVARGSEACAAALLERANEGSKYSYEDTGPEAFRGTVFSVCQHMEQIGHFKRDSSKVTILTGAAIPVQDRNNRYAVIQVEAIGAGAIQGAKITAIIRVGA